MNKSNRIIFIITGALVVAVAVLAFLNRGDAELRRALQENRQFLLQVDGETVAVVGLQDILDLQPVEFTTRLATSATLPREASFRGVELRHIYALFDVDVSGASLYVVRGLDGFASPLTAEEVASEGLVYLCIAMDGELLKNRSEGGWGPFLMVIRGAAFAQRWCKYVGEIDVR
jgi:DMSO/TMAO reductase YedYZ molybdopterin-dependent catalytic subunit